MTRPIVLLALAGAAALAAETTTINLLIPFADQQTLVASVVGVDSAATTFALGCPPGQSSDECGFTSSQLITQGPSTLAFSAVFTDETETVTEAASCKLNSKDDSAICTMVEIDVYNGTTTSHSEVVSTNYLTELIPVTITAGADKLGAAPGATVTGSSAPTTAATSAVTGTASAPASSTATAGSSTSAATTAAKPTSTNAAGPMNTQNAILAGVAAVIGGVMML